ncbi:MAG TPA: hypothetical protein VIL85_03380 [Thermomicrobiales bacterium]|jgi:hypothetical protein
MTAALATDDGGGETVAIVQEDGLLAYLRTLYRVAHAPEASHWCTPGHNRGQALSAPNLITLLTPVPPLPQEAR